MELRYSENMDIKRFLLITNLRKCVLEFEFMDEEGTGLGPTLEYLGLIASELRLPKHNLWRELNASY